jgi:hypothetical protein
MKHKRVLFGLLAAVAAMMFLFCGDSVVTTGNGSETPGTTPGTGSDEKAYNENVFIVAKTNKGFSVTNPEKLKKAAADVATIDLALRTVRTNAVGKASIWIQFGKGGSDVLDIGTTPAVIGRDWAGVLTGRLVLEGSLKGTLDVSEAAVPTTVDVAGPVTVVVVNKDGDNNSNVTISENVTGDVEKAADPLAHPFFVQNPIPYPTDDIKAKYLESGDVEISFSATSTVSSAYPYPTKPPALAVKAWISVSASSSTPSLKTIKDLGRTVAKGATRSSFKDTISLRSSDNKIWILIENPKDSTLNQVGSVDKYDIEAATLPEPEVEGTGVIRNVVVNPYSGEREGRVNVYVWGQHLNGLSVAYVILPSTTTTKPDSLSVVRNTASVTISGVSPPTYDLWDGLQNHLNQPTFSFEYDIKESAKLYFVFYNEDDITDITGTEELVLVGDKTAPTLSAVTADFDYPVPKPAITDPLDPSNNVPSRTEVIVNLKSTEKGDVYVLGSASAITGITKEKVVEDGDRITTLTAISPAPSPITATTATYEAKDLTVIGASITSAITKLYVVVVDTAGNISGLETKDLVLDAAPPTVTFAPATGFVRYANGGDDEDGNPYADGSRARVILSVNKNSTIYYKVFGSEADATAAGITATTNVADFLAFAGNSSNLVLQKTVSSTATSFDVTSTKDLNVIYFVAVGLNGVNGTTVSSATINTYDNTAPNLTSALTLVSRTGNSANFTITLAGETGAKFYYMFSNYDGQTELIAWEDSLGRDGDGALLKTRVKGDAPFVSPQSINNVTLQDAAGVDSIFVAVVDSNGNIGAAKLEVNPTPSATISISGFQAADGSGVTMGDDPTTITKIELTFSTSFTGKLYYGIGETATTPGTIETMGLSVSGTTVLIDGTSADFSKFVWYVVETGDGITTPILKSAPAVISSALTDPTI